MTVFMKFIPPLPSQVEKWPLVARKTIAGSLKVNVHFRVALRTFYS